MDVRNTFMERLFIGIFPSKQILDKIIKFKSDNNGLFVGKWIENVGIHLTLQFIGWVEIENIKKIESNIEKTVNNLRPFEIDYKLLILLRIISSNNFPSFGFSILSLSISK